MTDDKPKPTSDEVMSALPDAFIIVHRWEDKGETFTYAIGPIPPIRHIVEELTKADCECTKEGIPMFFPPQLVPPGMRELLDTLKAAGGPEAIAVVFDTDAQQGKPPLN